MMYSKFQGGGRPGGYEGGRPASTETNEIPISEIIECAKTKGSPVWKRLGFDDFQLPIIQYGKTTDSLFGKPPFARINMGTGTINLGKSYVGKFNTDQFAQALLMELGNFSNLDIADAFYAKIKNYQSGEEFARAIELVEYSVFKVVADFVFLDSRPLGIPVWTGSPKRFEDYISSPTMANHVKDIIAQWEEANAK
jgi:hypothetical protein